MILTNIRSGQVTTVKEAYRNAAHKLVNVEFADGTVWDASEMLKRKYQKGTEGDDKLVGYGNISNSYSESELFKAGAGDDRIEAGSGNDTIYGESGNDTIIAGDGNDMLIGGAGDDYMEGDYHADTYYIGAGDGNDTIYNWDITEGIEKDKLVFGAGILAEDISMSRSANNVVLTNTSTGQVTTIKDAYRGSNYRLYNVEFADETVAYIDYNTNSFVIEKKEEPVDEEGSVLEAVTGESVISETKVEQILEEPAIFEAEPMIGDAISIEVESPIEDDVSTQPVEIQIKEAELLIEDSAQILEQTYDDATMEEENVLVSDNDDTLVEEVEKIPATIDVGMETDKMAELMVQTLVEPSQQGIAQTETITELEVLTVSVQLWSA